MNKNTLDINTAYKNAITFTKSHYENFPVVSLFVNKNIRKHVAIFYQFARQADDIADEGDKSSESRLIELLKYENCLKRALFDDYENDFWAALKYTIDNFELSHNNFLNLIRAFKQDIVKNRYETYNDLINYCENSANPVGRTILQLNGIKYKEALVYSDAICTALQLTNFYQDINIDLNKNRIYLPLEELNKFGVTNKDLELRTYNNNFKNLLKFQTERVAELFKTGRHIIMYLSGRLRYQILWTILGGEMILKKIKKMDYDTLNFRPTLSKIDYINLMIKSFIIRK